MRENVGRCKAREGERRGRGESRQKGDAEELWPP